jgi:hypothetical protein
MKIQRSKDLTPPRLGAHYLEKGQVYLARKSDDAPYIPVMAVEHKELDSYLVIYLATGEVVDDPFKYEYVHQPTATLVY